MKKWIIVFFLLVSIQTIAQEKIPITSDDYQNSRVEMADVMRADGKIYVLVGIIGIVFAGIVVYLISTDRKVTRLERILRESE